MRRTRRPPAMGRYSRPLAAEADHHEARPGFGRAFEPLGRARRRPARGHRVVMRILDRKALWQLIMRPDLHFGDLYSSGRIQVRGDLLSACSGSLSL